MRISNPNLERVGRYQVPSLVGEILALDCCSRERVSFFKKIVFGKSNILHWMTTYPRIQKQHKFYSMGKKKKGTKKNRWMVKRSGSLRS